MTVRVDEITSADWSLKVGSPGEIVTDLDDIEQCIDIILTTRKGSVPHQPLFGCDAWLWLDKPLQIARPNIIRECVDALTLWEPRIDVISVPVELVTIGHVAVTVEYRLKNSVVSRFKEVSLGNN